MRFMIVTLGFDDSWYCYGPFSSTVEATEWAEKHLTGKWEIAQYLSVK